MEIRDPLRARRWLGWLALVASLGSGTLAVAQTVDDPGLLVESYAPTGLDRPTGFRFVGADEAFVIEKQTGRVKHLKDGVLTEVLDLDVSNNSERGLVGIEVHPQFDSNGHVYLYYSESSTPGDGPGAWAGNRLTRFVWNGSSLDPDSSFQDFFVPFRLDVGNGPNHDGGPMRFGPDGKLYLQTGDLNRSLAEQNRSGLTLASARTGGIHRFDADGGIPSDNPFTSQANADLHSLFAYGVRNGFGMAFDPETDRLWDTENGPQRMDEINLVAPGFNSGWLPLMGPESLDPQGQDRSDLLDLLMQSTYSDPEFSFGRPIGITAIQFLAGSALGEAYDDAVLVGDSNTGRLYLFRLNQARDGFVLPGVLADLVADTPSEADGLVFGSGFGVVSDIEIGPDGAVYVSSFPFFGGGFQGIRRIAPVPEPGTAGLLLLGLLALGRARRRTLSSRARRE